MSTAALDRTSGHLVGPDGTPLYRPTTLIGADAAAIIRGYFLWAMKNQLEPELVCASCFDFTRQSKATYNIDKDQIAIICQCQLRFFQGQTLPPEPVASSVTVKATDDAGAGEMRLSLGAAWLLRQYKKVLLDLGLKEMLRCNACYANGQEDGCEAQVTSQSIRIRCRCSNRIYTGMTV